MPTEDNDPLAEKCHRRTDDRHHLGTDADGDEHYCDAVLGAIWIVRENELAHIDTDHTVSEWIEVIEAQCGWTELNYSEEPTSEWLATKLAEAV